MKKHFFENGNRTDLYDSLKTGLKKDIQKESLGIFITLAFLIGFLGLGFCLIALLNPTVNASDSTRMICAGILILVVPLLFFRSTSNRVVLFFGQMVALLLVSLLVVPLLLMAFVLLRYSLFGIE